MGRKNEESVYTKLGFTLSGIIKNNNEKYFIDFIRSVNVDEKFYAIRTQEPLGDVKYFDMNRIPVKIEQLEKDVEETEGIPDKFKWQIIPVANNKIQLRSKLGDNDAFIDSNKILFNTENNLENNWEFFPSTGWKTNSN